MKRNTEFLLQIRSVRKLYDAYLERACRLHDLNRIEMEVIAFLGNNPTKNTARDLVELRLLQKANVSTAVEALQKKGLLEKEGDTGDRRLIHLNLTAKAGQPLRDMQMAQVQLEARLFDGFEAKEREIYLQMNQKIAENARVGLEELRNDDAKK